MTDQELVQFTLRYPDGWEESWNVRPDMSKESLITVGLQMLALAGVTYTLAIDAPQEPTKDSTPAQEEPHVQEDVPDAETRSSARATSRR